MAADKDEIAALEKNLEVMDKYSRQVGAFGMAAMAKIIKTKVLVIGLKGVGIEVAKNLVLAGVGQLSVLDQEVVQISDLGTNFYLTEAHVGKKSVAEASLPQLKSLNPLTKVIAVEGDLTNKVLKEFSAVVDCGLTPAEAKKCNETCRKNKTIFLRARVHGLAGYFFSDFGKEFTIVDKTGEPPVQRIINRIETDSDVPGEIIVHIIAEKVHNIDFDGHVNFVKFVEIEGDLAKYLNRDEPFECKKNERVNAEDRKVFDGYSIRVIVGEEMYEKIKGIEYTGAGRFIQVKKAVQETYKPLWESLNEPRLKPDFLPWLLAADGTKWLRADQLFFGMKALWAFETKHNRLPNGDEEKEVGEVVQLAKDLNKTAKDKKYYALEEIDEFVVSTIAKFATVRFQPLCCFYGGIVAQEVVKICGKYSPLDQWLFLDCFEVLPDQHVDKESDSYVAVTDEDRKPVGSRYDDLIKLIGKPLHQKLMRSSTFMIGCGALGCELLKNFALLGLACDPSKAGTLTVTDNDTIEVSNLSRQFLFREENVTQPKSTAAKASVQVMNPDFNVVALEKLVGPMSEGTFNAEFWESQDFITNALDNVTARLYVDSQCVFYLKPLLESGTLGTKCNSQVILPHMTASYADGPKDDLGDAIPMCTIRNFPTRIEHCIEWSRSKFTDLFEAYSGKAVTYLNDPESFLKETNAKKTDLSLVAKEIKPLEHVLHIVKTASDPETTFETCVREAYNQFHVFYRDDILSLIKAKPFDSKTEDGEPYWGKVRRFPSAHTFDPKNELHIELVLSMANLLSMVYGLVKETKDFERDHKKITEITSKYTPPAEVLGKVDLSEGEKKAEAGNDEMTQFEALVKELEAFAATEQFKKAAVEPASFEKDDDSNCHIDFITAASNLRAINYSINQTSRHECKMIAGKIIPAIATTTASATGLIAVELIKLIQPGKKIEAFKDSSNSLGVNYYQLMEPAPPIKAKDEYDHNLLADVKCLPKEYTKWNKTIVKGDKKMTLKEFIEEVGAFCEKEYGKKLNVSQLYHKNAEQRGLQGYSKQLFTDMTPNPTHFNSSLYETMVEFYGQDAVGASRVKLEASLIDDDDQPYNIAQLVFVFA